MHKITNDEGEEIEVYTLEEVNQKAKEAADAKDAEYKPKIEELGGKLTEAEKRAQERAGEFAQFRKLNEEQVQKLSVAERTIYENGLALQQERERREELETNTRKATIENAIRAKTGTDEKLFQKVKDTYEIIALDVLTPQDIERKINMAIGAIAVNEPDLVASLSGFSGGSFAPPVEKKNEGTGFAETEAGKAGASELGLKLS